MFKGHVAQSVTIELCDFQRGLPRSGQAVLETSRERAGFAMTGFVGVFASFVACD
jgi:hypothetical protein